MASFEITRSSRRKRLGAALVGSTLTAGLLSGCELVPGSEVYAHCDATQVKRIATVADSGLQHYAELYDKESSNGGNDQAYMAALALLNADTPGFINGDNIQSNYLVVAQANSCRFDDNGPTSI